jgi:type I restriction enzyme, R subunit
MFPVRTEVPKALIYAKSDLHANYVVQVIREEFRSNNEFCQKITCNMTGRSPASLLSEFWNAYIPRIVVTVDLIATGTRIKPLAIFMFMRAVKS